MHWLYLLYTDFSMGLFWHARTFSKHVVDGLIWLASTCDFQVSFGYHTAVPSQVVKQPMAAENNMAEIPSQSAPDTPAQGQGNIGVAPVIGDDRCLAEGTPAQKHGNTGHTPVSEDAHQNENDVIDGDTPVEDRGTDDGNTINGEEIADSEPEHEQTASEDGFAEYFDNHYHMYNDKLYFHSISHHESRGFTSTSRHTHRHTHLHIHHHHHYHKRSASSPVTDTKSLAPLEHQAALASESTAQVRATNPATKPSNPFIEDDQDGCKRRKNSQL